MIVKAMISNINPSREGAWMFCSFPANLGIVFAFASS